MDFVWDATKATANLRKHGVSFEEAQSIFESAIAITVEDDKHSDWEKREKTIGFSRKVSGAGCDSHEASTRQNVDRERSQCDAAREEGL